MSGMVVLEPVIPAFGKVVLSALSFLNAERRQRFLFGSSKRHYLAQCATQRLLGLGGPSVARIRYTRGLLKGYFFECFTSEQYFLMGPEFEAALQNTVVRLLKTGDIVYDIGANAGFWSLAFATLIGSSGCVFAFEPSPTNFARLERNVRSNGKTNIRCVQVAASDVQGIALFTEMGSGSHILSHAPPEAKCVRVSTARLDDYVWRDDNPRPSLIKIDIEGHAGVCLSGATEILAKAKPYVLFEIHNPEEEFQVAKILEQYSYGLNWLDSSLEFPRHMLASPH